MRRILWLFAAVLCLPCVVRGDADAVLQQMHERQLIIAGQRQGSVELARRELRDLMHQYAKEESKQQLGKALEWLESQANGMGFETDIESIYKGFNRYAGRASVLPLEMSFVQMAVINEKYNAATGTIKDYTDHARRGYSYAKRLYELSGVFEQNQEPAARRLSSNLSLLADAMSNYGDKIPLVGAFIAAYGNVTGEMLKAVDKLGEKLNARNPWLNDATYGSNELTRAYRNQMGGLWLKPVLGLRDCYVSDDGPQRVYIFDLKSRHRDRVSGNEYDGAFVPVSQYPPFDAMSSVQTVRELRRRYMMFDNAGVKTPEVRQVLREADRIVRLEPQLDYASIQAGQGFTVQVLAYYAVDGRPVPRSQAMTFVLSQDAGYWGTETQTAALGQFLTWTAPEAAGTFEMSVDLSDEAKSSGWRLQQGKPVKAAYIVGVPTQLSLVPASTRLATTRRQPVPIAVTLKDETGARFNTGDLVLEVKPRGQFGLLIPGSTLDPRPVLELSDRELEAALSVHLVPLDTAVIEPGLIHVSAHYKDGSKRLAAATASLRVQEPRIVDDSRIAVKTRERNGNVDFKVTVSDDKDQKVRVGTMTLTALTSGLFKTYRGTENSIQLDLARPGFATWVPGTAGTGDPRFRLEFSGAAWQDAMYSPVSMEWTLKQAQDEVEPILFSAVETPVDPEPLDLPADESDAMALGYVGTVEVAQWQQETEETPLQANLVAAEDSDDASASAKAPLTSQAPDPLFAGVGKGLGVGAPPVDRRPSARTDQAPANPTGKEGQTSSSAIPALPSDLASLPVAPSFEPVPVDPTAARLDQQTCRGYRSPVIDPPISVPAFAWNEAVPMARDLPKDIMTYARAPFPEADLKTGKARRESGQGNNGVYVKEEFTVAGHRVSRNLEGGKLAGATITVPGGGKIYSLRFVENQGASWDNGVNSVFGKDVVVDWITSFYVDLKNADGSENMSLLFDRQGNCHSEKYWSDDLITNLRRWDKGVLVEELRMMDDGTIVEQFRSTDRIMQLIRCSSYFKMTTGRWVKLKHGPEVFFHANGRPSKTLIYEKDKSDGREIRWHETGCLSELYVREGEETVFYQGGNRDGRLTGQRLKLGPNKEVYIAWDMNGASPVISIIDRDPSANVSHTVKFNLSGLRHGEEYWMKNGQRSGKSNYWKDGVQTR
jgi:hypothetical protein